MVITTPNAGSLFHLVRTARMRPVLPDPELFFSEVCYQNEGVS